MKTFTTKGGQSVEAGTKKRAVRTHEVVFIALPLTTATMDSIPREAMGNATSLYNFMRNVGGSFGIALATTLLSRSQQTYFGRLSEHVNPYDPAAASMVEQLRRGFMASGSDAATALSQAYAAIGGMVQRQAAMLSFIHVFQVLAIIFVGVLPLLFVMRRRFDAHPPIPLPRARWTRLWAALPLPLAASLQ